MDNATLGFLEAVSARFRDLESTERREETRSAAKDFVEHVFHRISGEENACEIDYLIGDSPNFRDNLKITEKPARLQDLVHNFQAEVFSTGTPLYHPAFFGLIPCSGKYVYSAAQHIASVSQVFPMKNFTNAGACKIEKSVLDWVSSFLGFPAESRGVFTSGTSMGAVLAFCAARDDRLESLRQLDRSVIYMTDQCHFSNVRSLNVAGLRECPRRLVPVDSHQRMDADALEKLILQDKQNGLRPFLVLGTLGTTNFGAVDPLTEIGHVSRRHGLWFHLDGAYGGFFLVNKRIKAKYHKGVELVDSITLDCHKGLSAPFGTSVLMVRDGKKLSGSMEWDNAPYIPDVCKETDYEPIDYTFEVTRPFRGFPVWLALRNVGTKLIEDHFEEKLLLAKHAYESLNAVPNIKVFVEPELSIVAFRFIDPEIESKDTGNELTKTLLRLINSPSTVILTPTRVEGIEYIRLCVLSFRSHLPEVNVALTLIKEKADWLSQSLINSSKSSQDQPRHRVCASTLLEQKG